MCVCVKTNDVMMNCVLMFSLLDWTLQKIKMPYIVAEYLILFNYVVGWYVTILDKSKQTSDY